MFNSVDVFQWPYNYFEKFVQGLFKFKKLIVNNDKIACFIGREVSANHVKFLKHKFLRCAKVRAKEN